MYKNLSTLIPSILNEPITESKKLFGILLGIVMQINIKIVKITGPFGILLWSNIQNMSDAKFEQMFSLESSNEIAIIQMRQYFNRLKALQ